MSRVIQLRRYSVRERQCIRYKDKRHHVMLSKVRTLHPKRNRRYYPDLSLTPLSSGYNLEFGTTAGVNNPSYHGPYLPGSCAATSPTLPGRSDPPPWSITATLVSGPGLETASHAPTVVTTLNPTLDLLVAPPVVIRYEISDNTTIGDGRGRLGSGGRGLGMNVVIPLSDVGGFIFSILIGWCVFRMFQRRASHSPGKSKGDMGREHQGAETAKTAA